MTETIVIAEMSNNTVPPAPRTRDAAIALVATPPLSSRAPRLAG